MPLDIMKCGLLQKVAIEEPLNGCLDHTRKTRPALGEHVAVIQTMFGNSLEHAYLTLGEVCGEVYAVCEVAQVGAGALDFFT